MAYNVYFIIVKYKFLPIKELMEVDSGQIRKLVKEKFLGIKLEII